MTITSHVLADLFLPAVTGISFVFAVVAFFYSIVRSHLPVKVNCWFCNTNSKVARKYSNSFVCPKCQQYNGFKEDGDYNCVIPAQWNATCSAASWTKYVRQSPKPDRRLDGKAALCKQCSLHQAFKVRALAEFTPVCDDNYDEEIEMYRHHLDKAYGLCRDCEANLCQVLGKQDSWLKPKLISWRLFQSSLSKKQLKEVCSRKHLPGMVAEMLGWLAWLTAAMVTAGVSTVIHLQDTESELWPSLSSSLNVFPIIAVNLHPVLLPAVVFLLALQGMRWCVCSTFHKRKEVLLALTWTTIVIGATFQMPWSPLLTSVLQAALSVVSAIASIYLVWSYGKLSSRQRTGKTRSHVPRDRLSDLFTNSFEDNSADESTLAEHSTLSPSAENRVPVGAAKETSMDIAPSHNSPLNVSLESLQISTPVKTPALTISKGKITPNYLFSEKPYHLRNLPSRSQILTPSKLTPKKNITQSSWVAGGYWGSSGSPQRPALIDKMSAFSNERQFSPVFPLSRSSSQSSGFVSQGSSASPPPAGTGSLCNGNVNFGHSNFGEFDHGSVYSEPCYQSWKPYYAPSNAFSCSSVLSAAPQEVEVSSVGSRRDQYFTSALANSSFSARSASPCSDRSCAFSCRDICNVSDARLDHRRAKNEGYTLSLGNPWVSFILGVSITVNGFLAALLLRGRSESFT